MEQTVVTSLKDLRKLKLRPPIEIQRAGSHFKARFRGHANSVFGSTAQEARERLLKTPSRAVKNTRRNAVIREMNWAYGFRSVKGKAA